jgi:hypothetical protein
VDPTSEARRRNTSVAVVALLLVALATLVVAPGSGAGSWSGPAEHSVEHTSEHPARALEVLRTVSFSTLHHAAHIERTSPGRATLATLSALVAPAPMTA